MIKYFLKNLLKTEFLAFTMAIVTGLSVIVEIKSAPNSEMVFWIPSVLLILLYVVVHIRRIWIFSSQTLRSIPLPYFFCLSQSYEWYSSAVKQQEVHLREDGIAWDEIQKNFRIHRQDWTFYDTSKLGGNSSEWINKIKEISHHFEHLTNRIEEQPLFHIFIAAPAPIALGVGALFAGRIPFTVHQHAGMVTNSYAKVHSSDTLVTAEEGYHVLNQMVTNFEYIEEKEDETINQNRNANDTLIILDFTGHRLPKPYPIEPQSKVIRLGLKCEDGHIPLNDQWITIAREISTIISSELNEGKNVSVLLGIPSTMAFLIGSILRTSSRFDIYYFNRSLDKYHKVYNLSDLD